MPQELIQKKEAVTFFLKKDILLSSDILDGIDKKNLESLHQLILNKIKSDNFLLLNRDLNEALENLPRIDINWIELEKSKAMLEKGKDDKIYNQFIKYIYTQKAKAKEEKIKIIYSYEEDSKKRD